MFRSKTIWFAILLSVFAASLEALPMFRDSITKEMYPYIFWVVSIVVGTLRMVTTEPLDER